MPQDLPHAPTAPTAPQDTHTAENRATHHTQHTQPDSQTDMHTDTQADMHADTQTSGIDLSMAKNEPRSPKDAQGVAQEVTQDVTEAVTQVVTQGVTQGVTPLVACAQEVTPPEVPEATTGVPQEVAGEEEPPPALPSCRKRRRLDSPSTEDILDPDWGRIGPKVDQCPPGPPQQLTFCLGPSPSLPSPPLLLPPPGRGRGWSAAWRCRARRGRSPSPSPRGLTPHRPLPAPSRAAGRCCLRPPPRPPPLRRCGGRGAGCGRGAAKRGGAAGWRGSGTAWTAAAPRSVPPPGCGGEAPCLAPRPPWPATCPSLPRRGLLGTLCRPRRVWRRPWTITSTAHSNSSSSTSSNTSSNTSSSTSSSSIRWRSRRWATRICSSRARAPRWGRRWGSTLGSASWRRGDETFPAVSPLALFSLPPPRPRAKQRRTTLTLEQKVKVVEAFLEGKSQRQIAGLYGTGKTQVSGIIRRREEVLAAYRDSLLRGERLTAQRRKRRGGYARLNQHLIQWYRHAVGAGGARVTAGMLRAKALQLAPQLGYHDFKASNGWLATFKANHNLKFSRPGRAAPPAAPPHHNDTDEDLAPARRPVPPPGAFVEEGEAEGSCGGPAPQRPETEDELGPARQTLDPCESPADPSDPAGLLHPGLSGAGLAKPPQMVNSIGANLSAAYNLSRDLGRELNRGEAGPDLSVMSASPLGHPAALGRGVEGPVKAPEGPLSAYKSEEPIPYAYDPQNRMAEAAPPRPAEYNYAPYGFPGGYYGYHFLGQY
ncbi:protein PRRC2A-like isoform X2 [Scylla paramamosain]|uniref:protein PRRC2A-like isoform X2 n=1 Tax=Scylla paramamosain TaxID=85552 RepID=UPI003082D70B